MRLIRAAQYLGGVLIIFGLSWASIAFTRTTGTVSAVWPADAVALALALRWGSRSLTDQGLVVLGATVAEALADVLYGSSLPFSLALASCNGLGIAVSLLLVRGLDDPFESPRNFARFLLGAIVIGPLAGSVPAVFVFKAFAGGTGLIHVFTRWYMAVALGVAVVAPLMLKLRWPIAFGRIDGRRLAAAAGAQLVFAAVAAVILFQPKYPPIVAVFPFLVLAVLSEKNFGAVLAVLSTTVLAVIATVYGRGPAVLAHYTGVQPFQVLQLIIGCMLMTAHPIAAMVAKLDRLAEENNRRRAEAEELNAIKTKLLAHVSHEIRSPLSGVTSMAELMSEGIMGELTPRQRETLVQIARAGSEVQTLARDLLDAATLQSGKASVNLSGVAIEEAVEAAVTAARFRGGEFGGSVAVVSGYLGDVMVAADPLRLRQILVNLIVNGLKYGGRPPVVQVCAYVTERGTVRFEVSDNGSGVDPQLREAMFKSFNRLGAEKSDIEGAGLGLALSRELALLQDGRLGVEDGEIGGARFWLELPQWKAATAQAA